MVKQPTKEEVIQLIKTMVREEFERCNISKAERPMTPNEEQPNIKNVDDNTIKIFTNSL